MAGTRSGRHASAVASDVLPVAMWNRLLQRQPL